jgi:D-alanyl-lipoteichoic acid acyltransferase DltB (MBOAT superfamily)
MLFNSYIFLVFFAVVLAVTRLRWSWNGKKLFLLAASYVFYAAWNPPFVMLLLISTIGDWFFARLIHQTSNAARRRLWLVASLVLNLGLLGYFKYAGLVLESLVELTNAAGINWHPAAPSIVLPVGISFYTFQTLSYTIDIYRGRFRPWHSFLDYALFVTFFPQLVAGPIVRAREFLPQCTEPKRASARQLGWGWVLIIFGLFLKVVIADYMMLPAADEVFQTGFMPTMLAAWTGVLAFAVQIFSDFAGYSYCAIGLALCLGFALPDNFRWPYAAIGFSDFWRRWHISLSSWLKDYLYISLGGNRRGTLATYRNLMITMLLGGLWHGASWMFVIWGGLHGLLLVAERLLRGSLAGTPGWSRRILPVIGAAGTFIAVCYTWVYFRAQSLTDAWSIVRAMTGFAPAAGAGTLSALLMSGVLLTTAAILLLSWVLRSSSIEEAAARLPSPVLAAGLALMSILVLICLKGNGNAFIYFQF